MSAVPMFLLMGFVAFYTGLTGGLFEGAKVFLARLPGSAIIVATTKISAKMSSIR